MSFVLKSRMRRVMTHQRQPADCAGNYFGSRRSACFCTSLAIFLFAAGVDATTMAKSARPMQPFQTHNWQRDARNPVLPPQEEFDISACMNPFVIRRGNEYWMFYAGGDAKGYRRVCLATCPVDDLTKWKRLGPLFGLGQKGAFDDRWAVLPCVHYINGKWHLYYTGQSTVGEGLQAFHGIGLYTSNDLLTWTKHSDEPVLTGDGFPQWADNKGIAGGARILEFKDGNERTVYRMYYTLATGTKSPNLLVDQAKQAVCADSYDGVKWFNKRVVLMPRLDADYENAACIALNIWKEGETYRAIYAGIGSRFGAYSICEAQSKDGVTWERGKPNENLALAPSAQDGNGIWANKMCEYPNVIEENGKLRLFYCGNGYGTTGIGTALADKLAQ